MKKILIICLLIAILGISILYFLAKFSQAEYVPIENLDSTYIGKTVRTSGRIVSVTYSKGNIFLTIYDKKSIDVPIFSNVAKYLSYNFKKGQKISVVGVVDEYKGKLQIVPKKTSDIKVIE
ncbi:MAG: exodeoxyribonuclease VII large subunit [Candidatus Aenigmatarchaeota archaeon]